MITREEEEFSSSTKQENDNNINTNLIVSARPSSSSNATISSSSWSRLKDPRIVRVSKAFGGKDRHSKVCTVRGLRDRRVRLSVPTAIQLYDLQDRLGLNQPSKVVDWLLNAAKNEIDELPPLQIPPPGLNFPENLHYSMLMAANNASSSSHPQPADSRDDEGIEENLRSKSKAIKDEKSRNEEMENLNLESHHHEHGGYVTSLSTSDFLQKPSNNPSLIPNFMNHNSLPYNNSSSFIRWDPSNLSLSHHQPEDNDDHHHFQNFNNNSNVPLQPTSGNMIPSGSQVVLYPPFGIAHPHNSYFDLQMFSSNSNNPLSSNSLSHQHHVESSTHHHQHHQQQEAPPPPPVRPFHFSVMANFLPSPSHLNSGNDANEDNEYNSR